MEQPETLLHHELRTLSIQSPNPNNHDDDDNNNNDSSSNNISRAQAITAVAALTGVSFLNTMGSGILTVALPRMATDLGLSRELLLWPAARVWITGSILFAGFTLACGLAKTGAQIIAFRTLLGVSIAMCLPCAVSLMTRTFPPGKGRNLGFASMGMGQPLGYSVGLILGGVFADSIGWRFGYYISAIINACLSGLAFWSLPSEMPRSQPLIKGLAGIDWVGAPLISVSLALVSFVLAQITESYHRLGETYIIVLLAVAIALLPIFIQDNSALHSSLMFLPMVIVGAITNIFTGYTVDKVQVGVLVFGSACITTISPLLMALIKPEWGYWRGPFMAMFLSPLHPDVLFTVSNLIISRAYPGQNQALAGAVFNSVSQVGNSVGLAVSAAVAASVTEHSNDDMLKGYQAAYWLMFAAMVVLVETDINTPLPEDVVAEIISQAPFSSVPGFFNLRDISNASTPSSPFPAALRPGLAYRSGAPPPTLPYGASDALAALEIKKIFDLRRPDERTNKPSPVIDGVEVVWVPDTIGGQPPSAAKTPPTDHAMSIANLVEMYSSYLESHSPVIKAIFEHIRDEPGKPFVFHCSAGKDRTGVIAALIHRLAGSTDEAIVHDFMLTRVGVEPGRQTLLAMMSKLYGESAWKNPVLLVMWGVHPGGMTGFLKHLDDKYDGAAGYLKNTLGFSGSDVETIRANLVYNKAGGSP
ncbi:major facilitator superfamily domain-containing protein [Aspergillus lucknowensis]|uniref:Major facilitator superfamily domain-containing protein n=1 Tax=Aspergillus lucknowensis TaxID=176173 RepID=A0ABR4LKL6_9EURO